MAESTFDAVPHTEEAADLAALQAENASLQDRLLRALAETENVRRRGERNVDDARKFAVQGLAGALLPVADNLGRAVAAATAWPGCPCIPARRRRGDRADTDRRP